MNFENNSNDGDSRKNNGRRPRGFWAAATDLISSYTAYYRAKTEQTQNPKPLPEGRWVKATAIGTILAAFLAFVAAIIFWCQLQTMEQSNRDSEAAYINGNRAWVIAGAPQFISGFVPQKVGDIIEVAATYENGGKAPAFALHRYQDWFWIDAKKALVKSNGGITIDSDRLSFRPNDTCNAIDRDEADTFVRDVTWPIPSGAAAYNAGNSKPNWPNATLDFFNGFVLFAYHGCFKYRTFNQVHQTAFCSFLAPHSGEPVETWKWQDCKGPRQNYAD